MIVLAFIAVILIVGFFVTDHVPLAYNLRSLVVRKTTTLATGLGVALVVFVLAASLMLSAGLEKTLGKSGNEDTAIVLRRGSDAELSSGIDTPNIGLILAAPGVKKDAEGAPIGVGEVVVVIAADKVGGEGITNVQVRGVPDNVMKFRPDTRIIAGRPAHAGTDEAIIGTRLRGRLKGMDLGQSFELRKNRSAHVVGVFEDGGSSFESEVWTDVDTLRAAFGREGMVSSVRVKLDSRAAYDGFAAVVEQDKQLGFEPMRETVYYAKQSQQLGAFLRILGGIISFFFSIGAMIGAMITMYSSVADRQREIGTLRALGFSRIGILYSFLVEAVVLAIAAGVVGIGASLALGFIKISMINFQSWSEIVFTFSPTPAILINAIAAAAGMGLLGGFLPAIRAARISPIQAMRG